MPLPDPLAHLQSRYDQLVADVESGAIPFDQAVEQLARLVVVDGAGAHWSMDVDGNFTVAAGPDVDPQPADPSKFQAARLPADPASADAPPWASSQLMGPSEDAPGGPAHGPHTGGPLPRTLPGPQMGRERSLGDGEKHGHGDGLKARLAPLLAKARQLPGVDKLTDNRRLAIVGAAVLLILIVTVIGKLTADPLEDAGVPVDPAPSPAASEQPTPPPADDPVQFPTDDGAAPPPAPAASVPSDEQVAAVVSELTSADRTRAAAVVVESGPARQVALQTSAHAGLAPTGLRIDTGPVTAGDRAATQPWTLVDTATGEVLLAATVTWVPAGDGWILTTWPAWQEPAQ